MTKTYARSRDLTQAVCECGHPSGDHDDWPVCDRCDCVEFADRADRTFRTKVKAFLAETATEGEKP